MIGETHARGDVVAEEVTHVGTDTEVVAFSLHVLQDEEVQIPLIVLGVGNSSSRHPRTFRMKTVSCTSRSIRFMALLPRWAQVSPTQRRRGGPDRLVYLFSFSYSSHISSGDSESPPPPLRRAGFGGSRGRALGTLLVGGSYLGER